MGDSSDDEGARAAMTPEQKEKEYQEMRRTLKKMKKELNESILNKNENGAGPSTQNGNNKMPPEIWNFLMTAEKYDGEIEWKVFQEQLDFKLSMLTTDEDLIKKVIVSCLTAKVYQTVLNHLGKSLVEATKEEIVSSLNSFFGRKYQVWDEVRKFRNLKMNEDETVTEYFNRTKEGSRNCEFKDVDEQVRDQLMAGVKSSIFTKMVDVDRKAKLPDVLDKMVQVEFKMSMRDAPIKVNAVQNVGRTGLTNSQVAGKKNDKWSNQCWRCNYRGHVAPECKFKDETCPICHKKGHISRACKQTKPSKTNVLKKDEGTAEKVDQLKELSQVSKKLPIYLNVRVDGNALRMEFDTGSGYTIIREETFRRFFEKNVILSSAKDVRLVSFTSGECVIIGGFQAKIEFEGREETLRILVAKNGSSDLLGRDFLIAFEFKICVDVNDVNVCNELYELRERMRDKFVANFPELFSPRLGKSKGMKIHLETTPELRRIFCKPRTVAYAYQNEIFNDLDQMVQDDILEKVDTCEFGTPIVAVKKPNGKFRICGDYKVTINKYLKDFNHPIPTADEIFRKMAGSKYFFKLDLRSAYNQLELDEDSSRLCAWSTPKGIFKLKRMPFGIKPASSIFQCELEKILCGVENVAVFIDDVVGGGVTIEEMLKTLQETARRLSEAGFTLREDKFDLLLEEIQVLGHIINAEGIKKDKKKVEAILEVRPPTNVKEVQSFAGLINYYGKFMPSLADTMRPINRLLGKGVEFNWDKDCQDAFEKAKREMAADVTLAHYDPKNQLILETDASDHAISCVLITVEAGREKPIAFWARTMNNAEKNYSVVDKEALAVVKSCKKYRDYLIGRKFLLKTDQRSLLRIFNPEKGIPQTASERLKRWQLFLSGLEFDITHIPSKRNNADHMSRLQYPIKETQKESEKVSSLKHDRVPYDMDDLRSEIAQDEELQFVIECVRSKKLSSLKGGVFEVYHRKREELSVEGGILFWNDRVIIPRRMRRYVLTQLHQGHFGMVKMKAKARRRMWWYGMDNDIEAIVSSCGQCLMNGKSPEKSELIPWEIPGQVWDRIHVDYMGPFYGYHWLVVIDAKSKWPEVFRGNSATTSFTIKSLDECFARFGLPNKLVSDNGTCFTSSEFKKYLKFLGIYHALTAPGHPASNGLAENTVKTVKAGMKKELGGVETRKVSKELLDEVLQTVLMNMRNTPHCTTGETPAKMMIGRDLPDLLSRMIPRRAMTEMKENWSVQQKAVKRQVKNYRGRRKIKFDKGEAVLVRDFSDPNKKRWMKATVVEVIGERHYWCLVKGGRRRKCNVEQMVRDGSRTQKEDEINESEDDDDYTCIRESTINKDEVPRGKILEDSLRVEEANEKVGEPEEREPDESVYFDCDESQGLDVSEIVCDKPDGRMSQEIDVEKSPRLEQPIQVPVLRRGERVRKPVDRLNL